MPIEIRELVIKATVSEPEAAGRKPSSSGNTADAKAAEVNVIVEKVLEILKEKSER